MQKTESYCKAALTGQKNRAAGAYWEQIINASCQYYRLQGIADIEKNSEPMRPISRPNSKGQFLACFTKKSGEDYIGVLKGGKFISFEAKCTDGDRLQRSVISSEQERQLDRHTALGADCFVMVAFRFEKFFKIPWSVFRDMKQRYGRKYITPEDVKEYAVRCIGGVLRFL